MTPDDMAHIHAASFTTPPAWSAAEISATLASPFAFVVSEPQGFLMGRVVAGEAELISLAVAPDARRTGVGDCLVELFFEQAKARGAESAFLEVSAINLPAQRLYVRKGFEPQGKRVGYYLTPEGERLDALVMVRRF